MWDSFHQGIEYIWVPEPDHWGCRERCPLSSCPTPQSASTSLYVLLHQTTHSVTEMGHCPMPSLETLSSVLLETKARPSSTPSPLWTSRSRMPRVGRALRMLFVSDTALPMCYFLKQRLFLSTVFHYHHFVKEKVSDNKRAWRLATREKRQIFCRYNLLL